MMNRHNLGTLVAVLVLGVAAAELFARYGLGLGDPPLSVRHPTIEYMFAPGQDVMRFGNRFLTNSYGMRSAEFARTRRGQDEIRVLVFGDSVVNGGGLTDHSQLATTMLKDGLERSSGKQVVVGNVSAGSWGPQNWLAYAQEFGFFDSNLIVLVISSHDYADVPTFEALDSETMPTARPYSALTEGLTRYLPRYLPGGRNVGYKAVAAAVPPDQDVESAMSALRQFLIMAIGDHRTVLVLQHPSRHELESGHPDAGKARIVDLCRKLGIQVVPMDDYFRRQMGAGPSPYRDDIHPNIIGQQVLYSVLLDIVTPVVHELTVPASSLSRGR